jgi:serine/threonine protein kinase/TolB-like protein
MNPDRWQQIKEVFNDALQREPSQRAAFLAGACADDRDLRAEVEKLLNSYEPDFMNTPGVGEAAEVISGQHQQLKAGQRLGRYRITQPLGAGGMGEVYLAHDTELERDVALKVLTADVATDQQRMQRFIQEAKTASALNHPNIITIYEVGQAEGLRFIATEYIKGETLRQRMRREPLSLSEFFEVAVQVCSALSAAHEANVLHRDIKPENVMLRPDGLVKVLDFGLAKLTEKATTGNSVDPNAPTQLQINTAPGVVMGTFIYMSPEQARGKEVDLRTDIWSFGVVLYEMIAGRLPFTGETTSDVIAAILKTHPVPLKQIVPETPEEVQRIVAKCLRSDQEARYQTARDLLVDLKTFKQELEFEAKLERTGSTEAEDRRVERTAAVAQTGALAQNTTPTISSAEYIATEIRNHKRIVIPALLLLLLGVALLGYYLTKSKQANDRVSLSGNDAVIESMAVLPFVNASQDANAEYLSDGITESLINNLSQLPGLKVTSRNSVFRYKGNATDAQKAGKELNVRAVLSGDVKQINDQLVINVELIDVRDDHQIWGDQYVRKFADILKVQNEITQEVSGKLRVKLSSALQQQIAKHSTDNPEAYREYLKGRFYILQYSPDAHTKALEHLNRAIAVDPTYALAYAGIADAYTTADDWLLPPSEALSKAKAAADKALALDSELAEGWSARGHARLHGWDKGAIEDLNRSIELAPNTLTNQLWLGEYYMIFDVEKSVPVMEKAAVLDPLSPLPIAFLSFDYYMLRQPERAIVTAKKAIELDPTFYSEHAYLARFYSYQGDFKSAIDELSKVPPEAVDVYAISTRGLIFGRQGKRPEVEKAIAELQRLSEKQYVSPFEFAVVYNSLGDRDQTFFWLEKAFVDRSESLGFIRTLPDFDPLRSDQRYADLLRRIGFSQ